MNERDERLEKKKHEAQRIRKLVENIEIKKQSSTDLRLLKEKYNLLLKRFSELESVFNFHKAIIHTISSGLLAVDHEGSITFTNRTSLETLGYNSEELRKKNIRELFADPKEADEIIPKVLTEHIMLESYETYWLSEKGEPLPVGFSTSLLGDETNKQSNSFVFLFRNITQVNNLRKQIERMDRLATLGELSAGIAHEIRNPLAGIKTSAQVLEESFSPGDFRSQLVSRIVKEIDRSNELLKKFFNFAKPSKPRQEFHHIEMIIDGVYLLLAPRLRKKSIHFRTEFAELIPQVYIDSSQIEQVILNVFINAVEAIRSGGEILVKTQVVENMRLKEDASPVNAVCISVKDNGVGVPADKLEKIFNPFYTTKSDGVGLGLSISTRLLQENGGKIELQSQEGEGSTFKIYLPVLKK
jgi:two-component system, NtrC family, sensor histidine kinase AtoS